MLDDKSDSDSDKYFADQCAFHGRLTGLRFSRISMCCNFFSLYEMAVMFLLFLVCFCRHASVKYFLFLMFISKLAYWTCKTIISAHPCQMLLKYMPYKQAFCWHVSLASQQAADIDFGTGEVTPPELCDTLCKSKPFYSKKGPSIPVLFINSPSYPHHILCCVRAASVCVVCATGCTMCACCQCV